MYSKNHITPFSIKEAADGLASGFCYYGDNGHVFLSNYKMNEIAMVLLEKTFRNGNELEKLLKEKNIFEIDGIVYHFTRRELEVEKEKMYEIIADDVTEIYEKTKRKREKNYE